MITLATTLCLLLSQPFDYCPPQLSDYLTPVDSLGTENFAFLAPYADSVRIFGYGEAAHGSTEFTEVASELFRYLSSEHGYDILAIETMYGEGEYLNQFVQGERNDLANLLENVNTSWRYRTRAFADLLRWMRAHNLTSNRKLSLRGCEMQYVKADVAILRDYLRSCGKNHEIQNFERHLWNNYTTGELGDHLVSYHKLRSLFEHEKESLIAASSEEEFAEMQQHVRIIGQFATTINQEVEQRKHDLRDLYMAENLAATLHAAGEDAKMMYWAHNEHVGDMVGNGIVDVAGHQLRKVFADEYYRLRTTVGGGEFYGYPLTANETDWDMQTFSFAPPDANSLTHCLQAAGSPHAFLDLRAARNDDDLYRFLHSPVRIMGGAGVHPPRTPVVEENTGLAYDGVLYLDRVTRIKWFEAEISDTVRAYLDEFFDLLQTNALDGETFDWPALRAKAEEVLAGAQVPKDTHGTLHEIVKRVNKHSWLMSQEAIAKWNNSQSSSADAGGRREISMATGRRIDERIGYVSLPGLGTGHRPSLQRYADSLQSVIAKIDGPEISAWVIDLRDNPGGNCWPMLAGIGPVLGTGTCGYFMQRDGSDASAWEVAKGEAGYGGYPQMSVSGPAYELHHKNPRVAVLTGPVTASAGEVVTVAFRGRKNTRSFGKATAGYSTTNNMYTLSDGAILNLTISIYGDRNKVAYGDKIAPDVETDDALEAALVWLRE